MKKTIWTFGLIMGAILCINMVLMVRMMYANPDFAGNDWMGYAGMVIVFSLIFFGIRNYRNKFQNGVISFGKAFKIGALIALLASTMYVITWVVYYYGFVPDFADVYAAHVLKNCTPEEATNMAAEMESFKKMYSNPVYVVLITFSEVLPVGLVVALISALLLKKKNTIAAA